MKLNKTYKKRKNNMQLETSCNFATILNYKDEMMRLHLTKIHMSYSQLKTLYQMVKEAFGE